MQNRVNLALPLLPDVVKQAGVTTRKRNPDILLVIAIYSPNGRYDQLYLSNFATIQVKDELARVDGVGDCQQFGQQDYSMRIWVDPDQLASLNLTAGDVANALREQNRQVAAGQIGQQPTAAGQPFEFTITTLGRLHRAGAVRRTSSSAPTPTAARSASRTSATSSSAPRTWTSTSKLDGQPNASLAVFALPDANALDTSPTASSRQDGRTEEAVSRKTSTTRSPSTRRRSSTSRSTR